MNENHTVFDLVQDRLTFLMSRFLVIESIIDKYERALLESTPLDIEEASKTYRTITVFYSSSMEVIRKLLQQMPDHLSKEEEELLSLFKKLTPSNRSKILLSLEKRVRNG